MRVLDLGCGTGDLALGVAKRLGKQGEVVGLDFSENMLKVAQRRFDTSGYPMKGRFRLVQGRAEDIPFEEKPYDLVVSGFVLRNIHENIGTILRGVYASLKGGGQISFLDFTEPPGKWRLGLWKFYMNVVAALYGRFLFGKQFPEFYMTRSAERFLKAPEFIAMLERSGFESVRVQKFMMGIIVLYQARKPEATPLSSPGQATSRLFPLETTLSPPECVGGSH